MAEFSITVPAFGGSVATATVSRWIKNAGDRVAADEQVVELETDKVTVEVNAPAAGVIENVAVEEGAEVAPGAVLRAVGNAAPGTARNLN